MILNVYKNQKTIAKTYEVDEYDVMYGTVEDVFDILDGVNDMSNTEEIIKMIIDNRAKLDDLLIDIFGVSKEELRHVKVRELVEVFSDLLTYVMTSFQSKN